MLHRGGRRAALTPLRARTHVAEEGAQSVERDIWKSSVLQASCRTDVGRVDVDQRTGGWTGHRGRQRRWCEEQAHVLTLPAAPDQKAQTESHESETETYLVSLETGLSFDLQSAGDSSSAAERQLKTNKKNFNQPAKT